MVKRKSKRGTRVAMTAYVSPGVKQGMKIAATLYHNTISDLIESLCLKFLDECPGVKDILEREG